MTISYCVFISSYQSAKYLISNKRSILIRTYYLFRSGKIDAFLDDTPILAYAKETMDVECKLRLVNNGFGEDAYGIGLPKGSWLKVFIFEC